MTNEEVIRLKRVIEHFASWYDVIGLDNIEILEKTITYIEQLEKEKCELLGIIQGKDEVIKQLKAQIKSLEETLRAIATDTNEHITHNVAQNELDKWDN